MKNGATRMLAAVALACLLPAGPAIAAADAVYPARPVRMLIPFPAGGASDTIGRTLGEQLSLQLGQPVVMDNRPGAAGRLATEMLTQAQPDGYTLLVGGVGPISISPSLYRKLGYGERDFTPLTRVAEIINVMVVNPSSGAATVRQFIDWAKKRPTDVRYGSSGPGQLDHLAGEFFQRLAGVPLTHVPYKGGGPALVDLIAGDLHLMFSTYVVALPHVKTGRLRALAVTTLERQPLLPELPTVAETLPGYGVSNWNGIFAPARTPRHIAERLTAEIRKALQAPDLKRRQAVAGIEPGASASSAEFVKFIRDDTAQWEKIVRAAGMQLE